MKTESCRRLSIVSKRNHWQNSYEELENMHQMHGVLISLVDALATGKIV